VRLSADGSAYAASTYVGPTRFTSTTALAVDRSGFAYVAGTWDDGPVRAWIDRVDASGIETGEIGLNGSGGTSRPGGLAVDAAGAVYVAGMTTDADFPTTRGAPQPASAGGNGDAFISKVLFSTPGDVLPTVSLTSPGDGTIFASVTAITIAAAA